MTHPIIKTDNYILITSDEEIKSLDAEWSGWWHGGKKVIAHLPLNNSLIHKGVPLLPPLPDNVDNLAEKEFPHLYQPMKGLDTTLLLREGFVTGYKKAKEKYKFTEDDIKKAIATGYDWCHQKYIPDHRMIENFIQSLSQPKLPVGFKCEMEEIAIGGFIEGVDEAVTVDKKIEPKIINGVMQGEWIFE